jgi:hypothetical protein
MLKMPVLAACLASPILLHSAPSFAQEVPDDDVPAHPAHKEYPWAAGVGEETRKAATELFLEARRLYQDSLFAPAAEKYRAGLALCKCHHPAAHYNLMLSLVNLDRPIEMYDNLVASMENGLERLSKERYEQAKNFKVLLEKQLVAIDMRCDVPGAKVTFDGRTVLTGPGQYRGMERPGMHTVLALKEGMHPNQVIRQMNGGQRIALNLELKTEEELTVYERRWPAWKPWAVVGAGAVVALASGALHYAAFKSSRASDSLVVACGGCGPRLDIVRDGERSATMEKVAIGGYAAGGAAMVTGVVLAYLNRAKSRVRHYDVDAPPAHDAPSIVVAPIPNPSLSGVAAHVYF